MKRFAGALLALTILASNAGHAGNVRAQVAASSTKAHITALASERAAGRLTGSPGERVASDYIVSQLQRIGAKPIPGQTDYLLPFAFTAGSRDGGSSISIKATASTKTSTVPPTCRRFPFPTTGRLPDR